MPQRPAGTYRASGSEYIAFRRNISRRKAYRSSSQTTLCSISAFSGIHLIRRRNKIRFASFRISPKHPPAALFLLFAKITNFCDYVNFNVNPPSPLVVANTSEQAKNRLFRFFIKIRMRDCRSSSFSAKLQILPIKPPMAAIGTSASAVPYDFTVAPPLRKN